MRTAFLVLGVTAAAIGVAAPSIPTAQPSPSPAPVSSGFGYAPPVERPVRDPFRAPPHRYGPGNRGLEYATVEGDAARAIGPGIVTFAGPVGGRLAVTVLHPDGLRSSLTGLARLAVGVGDRVSRGTVLGRASDRLHLGVRHEGRYLDPATLFRSGPAILVRG